MKQRLALAQSALENFAHVGVIPGTRFFIWLPLRGG